MTNANDITESIDVAVPVRTAYDQWTQFESFPLFMSGVDEVRQTDDTHTHWKISMGGVTREFDAEITEQIPDERVAWTSRSGTKHAGVVTFHQLDPQTTRVTLQLDTEPHGIVEKIGDKLGVPAHQASTDLKRFKTFIEEHGSATGTWRGEVSAN
jgi:uncharacterized membrane protein